MACQPIENYGIIGAGIPQIKPTFLDIAPSGIPSNIIPHSKGVKCGLIRSNSPFSYSPTFPIWLNIPLSKSSAFFKPLSICETLAVGMAIITP